MNHLDFGEILKNKEGGKSQREIKSPSEVTQQKGFVHTTKGGLSVVTMTRVVEL